MNCRQINEIPIQDYLAEKGLQPSRISGLNLWYESPLRQENNPSFKVNTRINQWYDFGEGKGGKLVDLLLQISKLPLAEIIQKFSDHAPGSFSLGQQIVKTPSNEEEPKIAAIKPLQNQALLEYLEERKVPLVLARKYCEEIYYRVRGKNYFAISFRNDSGGYEIRNRYFKGSLLSKDISTIHEPSERIYLFEGFMDFLSAKAYFKERPFSSIVLNSASHIDKGIAKAQDLREQPGSAEFTCFFDHNTTGRSITEKAIDCLSAIDGSHIYKGYVDFNELHQGIRKDELYKELRRRQGRKI